MSGEHGYEVGYKKPPVHSRFPKGKSPNPRGRPRKAASLSAALEDELAARVTITENGKARTLSKGAVMMKALVNKAMKGDIRAIKEIAALQVKAGKSAELGWGNEPLVIELDLGERKLRPPHDGD